MLRKNESYPYCATGHAAARDDRGTYYCRAISAAREGEYDLCGDCPLFGGFVQDYSGKASSVPECWYFDIAPSEPAEETPADLANRMRHLISAGLFPEFPYFLSEKKAIDRFGLLEEAIQFAAVKHYGQERKGSHLPYICHPVECAMLAAKMTDDVEVQAAAALHDTLEDTDTTRAELKERFGNRVTSLVAEESENKRKGTPKADSWIVRKQENIDRIRTAGRDAQIVMLADKLSNIRASAREERLIGDRLFERFNMKDKSKHAWYYREVLRALRDLSDLPQYREFETLVNEVFPEEP